MRSIKQDEAIARITEQMMSTAKDGKPSPEIQAIEEMLTEICTTDAVAEKLMADGKNLQGAFGAIESEARKEKGQSSCVCIPPHKALQIIEQYYGITDDDKAGSNRPKRRNNTPIDVLSQI